MIKCGSCNISSACSRSGVRQAKIDRRDTECSFYSCKVVIEPAVQQEEQRQAFSVMAKDERSTEQRRADAIKLLGD